MAQGERIRFPGFLVIYQDPQKTKAEGVLPALKEGELLTLDRMQATQHYTKPPAHYTEASLVKKLEELGVQVQSTPGLGYQLKQPLDLLDAKAIAGHASLKAEEIRDNANIPEGALLRIAKGIYSHVDIWILFVFLVLVSIILIVRKALVDSKVLSTIDRN